MEIKADNHHIWYEPDRSAVIFQGSLRLAGSEEYAPIADLLHEVSLQHPENLTLDLRKLDFLNSSGINMLSKFVIKMRQKQQVIQVRGSRQIPWQSKSLKNLQRLMPSLVLEIEDVE